MDPPAGHPEIDRYADHVRTDPDIEGVPETDHPAIAEYEVQAGSRQREYENARPHGHVEGLSRITRDHGHERKTNQEHQARDGARRAQRNRCRADGHRRAGNRPWGRIASTIAMNRYMSSDASAGPAVSAVARSAIWRSNNGRYVLPIVSTTPTMRAPKNAPRIDPIPPITMTTSTAIRT